MKAYKNIFGWIAGAMCLLSLAAPATLQAQVGSLGTPDVDIVVYNNPDDLVKMGDPGIFRLRVHNNDIVGDYTKENATLTLTLEKGWEVMAVPAVSGTSGTSSDAPVVAGDESTGVTITIANITLPSNGDLNVRLTLRSKCNVVSGKTFKYLFEYLDDNEELQEVEAETNPITGFGPTLYTRIPSAHAVVLNEPSVYDWQVSQTNPEAYVNGLKINAYCDAKAIVLDSIAFLANTGKYVIIKYNTHIDYIRDDNGNVIYNVDGNPVGYSYYFDGEIFNQIGRGNERLDNGETLQIREYIHYTDCSLSGKATYEVYYGNFTGLASTKPTDWCRTGSQNEVFFYVQSTSFAPDISLVRETHPKSATDPTKRGSRLYRIANNSVDVSLRNLCVNIYTDNEDQHSAHFVPKSAYLSTPNGGYLEGLDLAITNNTPIGADARVFDKDGSLITVPGSPYQWVVKFGDKLTNVTTSRIKGALPANEYIYMVVEYIIDYATDVDPETTNGHFVPFRYSYADMYYSDLCGDYHRYTSPLNAIGSTNRSDTELSIGLPIFVLDDPNIILGIDQEVVMSMTIPSTSEEHNRQGYLVTPGSNGQIDPAYVHTIYIHLPSAFDYVEGSDIFIKRNAMDNNPTLIPPGDITVSENGKDIAIVNRYNFTNEMELDITLRVTEQNLDHEIGVAFEFNFANETPKRYADYIVEVEYALVEDCATIGSAAFKIDPLTYGYTDNTMTQRYQPTTHGFDNINLGAVGPYDKIDQLSVYYIGSDDPVGMDDNLFFEVAYDSPYEEDMARGYDRNRIAVLSYKAAGQPSFTEQLVLKDTDYATGVLSNSSILQSDGMWQHIISVNVSKTALEHQVGGFKRGDSIMMVFHIQYSEASFYQPIDINNLQTKAYIKDKNGTVITNCNPIISHITVFNYELKEISDGSSNGEYYYANMDAGISDPIAKQGVLLHWMLGNNASGGPEVFSEEFRPNAILDTARIELNGLFKIYDIKAVPRGTTSENIHYAENQTVPGTLEEGRDFVVSYNNGKTYIKIDNHLNDGNDNRSNQLAAEFWNASESGYVYDLYFDYIGSPTGVDPRLMNVSLGAQLYPTGELLDPAPTVKDGYIYRTYAKDNVYLTNDFVTYSYMLECMEPYAIPLSDTVSWPFTLVNASPWARQDGKLPYAWGSLECKKGILNEVFLFDETGKILLGQYEEVELPGDSVGYWIKYKDDASADYITAQPYRKFITKATYNVCEGVYSIYSMVGVANVTYPKDPWHGYPETYHTSTVYNTIGSTISLAPADANFVATVNYKEDMGSDGLFKMCEPFMIETNFLNTMNAALTNGILTVDLQEGLYYEEGTIEFYVGKEGNYLPFDGEVNLDENGSYVQFVINPEIELEGIGDNPEHPNPNAYVHLRFQLNTRDEDLFSGLPINMTISGKKGCGTMISVDFATGPIPMIEPKEPAIRLESIMINGTETINGTGTGIVSFIDDPPGLMEVEVEYYWSNYSSQYLHSWLDFPANIEFISGTLQRKGSSVINPYYVSYYKDPENYDYPVSYMTRFETPPEDGFPATYIAKALVRAINPTQWSNDPYHIKIWASLEKEVECGDEPTFVYTDVIQGENGTFQVLLHSTYLSGATGAGTYIGNSKEDVSITLQFQNKDEVSFPAAFVQIGVRNDDGSFTLLKELTVFDIPVTGDNPYLIPIDGIYVDVDDICKLEAVMPSNRNPFVLFSDPVPITMTFKPQNFTFISNAEATPIPLADIAPNYPAGTKFYGDASYETEITSIPRTLGVNTYYAFSATGCTQELQVNVLDVLPVFCAGQTLEDAVRVFNNIYAVADIVNAWHIRLSDNSGDETFEEGEQAHRELARTDHGKILTFETTAKCGNGNNDVKSNQVILNVCDEPAITPDVTTDYCAGGALTGTYAIADNGSSITEYTLTFGEEIIDSGIIGAGISMTSYTIPSAHLLTVDDNNKILTLSLTNACGTTENSVEITVLPVATAAMITTTDATICVGAAVPELSAELTVPGSIANPIFNWYNDAGILLKENASAYTPSPAPTVTTTYYVSVQGDGEYCENTEDDRQPVTLTVLPLSTAELITVTGTTIICSGTPTTLTASATGVNNPEFAWYDSNEESAELLFTGDAYTTETLTNDGSTPTYTYWVSVKGDNYCENEAESRKQVNVTVVPAPTLTVSGNFTLCDNEKFTLNVTSTNTSNAVWYGWFREQGTPPEYVRQETKFTPAANADIIPAGAIPALFTYEPDGYDQTLDTINLLFSVNTGDVCGYVRDTITLRISAGIPDGAITIVSQPVEEQLPCMDTSYMVRIDAIGQGGLGDITVSLWDRIATGLIVNKVEYSMDITDNENWRTLKEYPAESWEMARKVPADSTGWSLDYDTYYAQLRFTLDDENMQTEERVSLNKDGSMWLRFTVNPQCDFYSGGDVVFLLDAKDQCRRTEMEQAKDTSEIFLLNFGEGVNLAKYEFTTPMGLSIYEINNATPALDRIVTWTITYKLTDGVIDYDKEFLYFILPEGVGKEGDTILNVSSSYLTKADFVQSNDPGNKIVEFGIPLKPDIEIGDTVTFSFSFRVTGDVPCRKHALYMEIIHDDELVCNPEEEPCAFSSTRAGYYPDLTVQWYDVAIATDQTGGQTVNSFGAMTKERWELDDGTTGDYLWTGKYLLTTTSGIYSPDIHPDAPETIPIKLYWDINNDGMVDEEDRLVKTIDYPAPQDEDIPADAYITIEIDTPIPVGQSDEGWPYQLIATTSNSGELCDSIFIPLVTLTGDDMVCQKDTVLYVAPAEKKDYQYTALPIEIDGISGATPQRIPLEGKETWEEISDENEVRFIVYSAGKFVISAQYKEGDFTLNPTDLYLTVNATPYLYYADSNVEDTTICKGTSVELSHFLKDSLNNNIGGLDIPEITWAFYLPDGTLAGNITADTDEKMWVAPLTTTTYTVIAEVASGCNSTELKFTVHVEETPIIGSVTIESLPSCSGNEGAIRVVVTPAGGNYTYNLDGGESRDDLPADGLIEGLAAGTYKVYVWSSDSDCAPTVSLPVSLNPSDNGLTVTTQTDVVEDCTANGSITITAKGGYGALKYKIGNDAFADMPSSGVITTNATYATGEYLITVQDATSCQATTMATVMADPASVDLNLNVTQWPICDEEGQQLGELEITIDANLLDDTWYYTIDGSNRRLLLNGMAVESVAAGTHTVVVTSEGGCMAKNDIQVYNNTYWSDIRLKTITPATCGASGDGVIKLQMHRPVSAPPVNNASSVNTLRGTDDECLYYTITDGGNINICDDFNEQDELIIEGLYPGTYTITVTDANTGCFVTLVGIVVGSETDYLIAVDDHHTTYMNMPVTGNVLDNDFDDRNAELEVTAPESPATTLYDGSITISAEGVFTYTPKSGFIGRDSIQYTIVNNCGNTDKAWVIINVLTDTPGVHPPIAVDDYYSMINDGITSLANLDVTANDSDPQGDPLEKPTRLTDVSNGTLTQNEDGTFNYTPNEGFIGVDEFTYEVCNAKELCDTAHVYFYVYPQNTGSFIMALPDAYSILMNTTLTVNVPGVLGNDILPAGNTTVTIKTDVMTGASLTLNDNGSFTYIPKEGYYGPDYFTYEVCVEIDEETTLCDQTTVNITVVRKGCQVIPPVVISSQQFCAPAYVADLYAEGENIQWYDEEGHPLDESEALEDGAYYASQTIECESTVRSAVTVRIKENLLLPTPDIDDQTLCYSDGVYPTLADLIVKGTTAGLVWYDGQYEEITTNITLTNGMILYAAYRAGACESNEYKKVTITIDDVVPIAPVIADQSFCEGATIAAIRVPNNQIKWYTTSTGGTALVPTTLLTNGIYYAEQQAGYCQSATRTAVAITIDKADKPIAETEQYFCNLSALTLGDLAVQGYGVVWYADASATVALPLTTTSLVAGSTYYAAQTSEDCESDLLGVTVYDYNLLPPTVTNPQQFCGTPTVADLQPNGANIRWYYNNTLLTDGEELVDGHIYYAAQSNGDCESNRSAVKVIIKDNIFIPRPLIDSPQAFCEPGVTLADVAIPANTAIVWYADATTTTPLGNVPLVNGVTYYAATKAGSCESTTRTAVEITIESTPAQPEIAYQSFCLGALVSDIHVPNNQIRWYAAPTGGVALLPNTLLSSGTYYAALQAGEACESTRTAVEITIGQPEKAIVESEYLYCSDATVGDLKVTGYGVIWYNSPESNIALPLTDKLTNETIYYAVQSNGSCRSEMAAVTAAKYTLTPPLVTSVQNFCQGATAAVLRSDGLNVVWYDNPEATGDPISPTQELTDGALYYAFQSNGECMSGYSMVKAVVREEIHLEAPPVPTPQTVCESTTLADVVIPSNTILVWYDAQVGGNLVDPSTVLTQENSPYKYYATYSVRGCANAERTEVTINVEDGNEIPAPEIADQHFCVGAMIGDIVTPTYNIKWYDAAGNLLPDNYLLSDGIYYAVQKVGNCQNATSAEVTITLDKPDAPTLLQTTQYFCSNADVADLVATGYGMIWYDAATGGNLYNIDDPLEDDKTYYGAQSSGSCRDGDRVEVKVIFYDVLPPRVPSVQEFCIEPKPTIADLASDGVNVKWYNASGAFMASNVELVDGATYYASQSNGTCESVARSAVKVRFRDDLYLPMPDIADQTLCGAGTATLADIAVIDVDRIVWYVDETTAAPLPANHVIGNTEGAYTYYAALKAGSCESETRKPVTITIDDNAEIGAPEIESPQSFCEGAMLADIVVPNNQVIWYYDSEEATIPLPQYTVLINGANYWAAQKAGSCESDERTPVEVLIGKADKPIAETDQNFCDAATVGDLEATGYGIKWFEDADETDINEALDLNTGLTDGKRYYAAQTSTGACDISDKVAVTAHLYMVNPPRVTSPQQFCGTPIVADLQPQGTNLLWYYEATDDTPLADDEALDNNHIYYVSQVNGICESNRSAVMVKLVDELSLPAPSIADQSFCESITLSDVAIESNKTVTWYTDASGNTSVSPDTEINETVTYYAAYAAGSCESTLRTEVTITITETAIIPAPAIADQNFCLGATIGDIVVPNNQIRWYDAAVNGNELPSNYLLEDGAKYYAFQASAIVCGSTNYAEVTITIDKFDAPIVATSQEFCNSSTVSELEVTGSGIKWYYEVSSGNFESVLLTDALVSGTYRAVQSNGDCEGAYAEVTVNVAEPSEPELENTTASYCAIEEKTVNDLSTAGAIGTVTWYDAAIDGIAYIGTELLETGTYYASQTIGDCESTLRTAVEVTINDSPVITLTSSATYFCINGSVTYTTESGMTDYVWDIVGTVNTDYTIIAGGTETDNTATIQWLTSGNKTVTVNYTNADGCTAATPAIAEVEDGMMSAAPEATTPQVFCDNATIENLQAKGENIKWYYSADGTDEVPAETKLSHGTTYYAARATTHCESVTRTAVTVHIDMTLLLEAPMIESPQHFCSTGVMRLSDIATDGNTNIIWYDAAEDGNEVALSTVLHDGDIYYAAIKAGDCESADRTAVALSINIPLESPVIEQSQNFCIGAMIANISVPNNQVVWYYDADLTILMSPTDLLEEHTYYAVQSAGECESASYTAVTITLDSFTAPEVVAAQYFCNSSTVSELEVTGSGIKWYYEVSSGNFESVLLTDALVSGTYRAVQSNGDCEGAYAEVTVNVAEPSEPELENTTASYCAIEEKTVNDLSTAGAIGTVTWYDAAIDGIAYIGTELLETGTYYASQTIGDCESTLRTAVEVTINDSPVITLTSSATYFCINGSVTYTTESGMTDYVWDIVGTVNADYTIIAGGTETDNTATIQWLTSGNKTVTVNYTNADGCTAATPAIAEVEDGMMSAAPEATTPQVFCDNATIENLQAKGENIKWYYSADGTDEVPAETKLSHGTTYYAARATTHCESVTRTAVTVHIDMTLLLEAPMIESPQHFCSTGVMRLSDIATDGNTNIIWYDAAEDGNEVALSTVLHDGDIYYAAIKAGDCESADRTAVALSINIPLESLVIEQSQNFCIGAMIANISVPNNQVVWYYDADLTILMSPTDLLEEHTYYAVQSAGECESASFTAVTITLDSFTAPIVATSQEFCNSSTVSELEVTGSGIKWYYEVSSGNFESVLLTDALVSGTYRAVQSNGDCEGAYAEVTVNVAEPSEPELENTTASYCAIEEKTVNDLSTAGAIGTVTWYDAAIDGIAYIGTELLETGTYYASQTIGDCESTLRTAVEVTINDSPVITLTSSATYFCINGSVTYTTESGMTDYVWDIVGTVNTDYTIIAGGTETDNTATIQWLTSGNKTVTVNYTNADGCTAATPAIAEVEDGMMSAAPEATTPQIFCDNATIENLQAKGENIKWYYSADGTDEVPAETKLSHGTTYYAARATTHCESVTRTAVTVHIDMTLLLEAPMIESPQHFCSTGVMRLSDIATDGNTNIIWYDAAEDGNEVALSTILHDGDIYYAAIKAGDCESADRTAVALSINIPLESPVIEQSQNFCIGAMIANISVPNNQVVWYYDADLTILMSPTDLLEEHTYYAVQSAGECESASYTAVTITLDSFTAPIVATSQEFCNNSTVSELEVTGSGIKWYYEVSSGNFESVLLTDALVSGTYRAVQSNGDCEGAYAEVQVQVAGTIAPPSVTSPQTFCEGATVAHLQAQGINIKWYEMVNNVYVLRPAGFALENDHIYYAVQSLGDCESTYSPVKVIIDNNVFLDAPTLPGIFDICGTGSTLADIPTYGNTNIVWYDSFTGGTKYDDPATVTLEDGQSYFAAQSGGGTCVSASRTEVIVTIDNITPVAPVMESPQQFCEGALVGNLAVPNNQIVWYSAAEGGEVLPLTMPLIDGGVYYAAQKAGDCESATRTAVTVKLTQYLKPDAQELICVIGKMTLADLPITGAGIVWYDEEGTSLPLSTVIPPLGVAETITYWAAQTSGDCESERIAITLTGACYNPRGTIFPFVHIGDNDFDNQFIATVKLYSLPPESTLNKISYVRSKSLKLFETLVIYYDETTYIAGTPKYPGVIGFFDNPGNPILWSAINQFGASPNNTVVTDVNDRPMSPIGQFGFENVAAGKYVIEVARQGFLTRYGVVTVGADQYLGHREILGGDVNGDLNINDKDLSVIVSKYSTYKQPNYKWEYDIDGSSKVGSDDASIIKIYLGAYGGTIYEETYKFLRNDY